jgi:hypothetical protein
MKIQGIRMDDQLMTLYHRPDGIEILFRVRRDQRCLSAFEFKNRLGRWQKDRKKPSS